MQNSNQFLKILSLLGKNFEKSTFFSARSLKNGVFGKNSEIRREAKKIFDLHPQMPLKTPPF